MTTNGKKKPVSITVSSSKSDLIPDKTLMHLRFTGFSTKGMPYGEGLVFGFVVVRRGEPMNKKHTPYGQKT